MTIVIVYIASRYEEFGILIESNGEANNLFLVLYIYIFYIKNYLFFS